VSQPVFAEADRSAMPPDFESAPRLDPDSPRPSGYRASSARGWKVFLAILGACTIAQSVVFLVLIAAGYVGLRVGLLSMACSVLALIFTVMIVAMDSGRRGAAAQTGPYLPSSAHFLFGGIMLVWLIQIHFFGSIITPLSILITLTALIGAWLFGPRAGWVYFGLGSAGWILTIVLEKLEIIPFFPGYQKDHEVFVQIFNDTTYVAFRVFVFVAVSGAIIHLLNQFQNNLRSRNRELAELSRRLEVLATTDALTGLLNRRTVMEHLRREIVRAQRQGKTLAVVMADLDDFKKINDTHGHAAGDRVLQTAAAVFQGHLRPYDLLARIGGEEFLFVIANGAATDVGKLVERMRAALAQRDVELPNGGDLRATSSFGCAILDVDNPHTLDELLRAADEALYASKRAGKNRCTFAAPAVEHR
jgi:diguanylate cyclase (GGDEF)-like protein